MADDTRDRILHAAAALLAESGGAAVSTRAVCRAAGVAAPTLYHHFGDKQGLFDAVAAYGFERYLAGKRALPVAGDPVQRLRDGWDLHVGFGRTHPAFYTVMFAAPRPGPPSAGAQESHRILLDIVTGIARAGRLTVPVPAAVRMIQATGVGVVLTLISDPAADDLSARTREAVIAAITTPADPAEPTEPAKRPAAHAVALRAALSEPSPLTPGETALLNELLDRLATP